MAFSTNCTNKGCYKQMDPYLDTSDNKVYCSLCDQEIKNITEFTKRQMKSMKQFRNKLKIKSSYSVKCNHCKHDDRPTIDKNDLFCSSCKKQITSVTDIYKKMLIEQMEKLAKETD